MKFINERPLVAGLIAGLRAAQKEASELQPAEGGQGGDKLPDVDKMNRTQLEALAKDHNIDLSACTNNTQRADKLKAAGVGA